MDFGVAELAQYGAVGVALALVSIGGFVSYKLGMALIDAAKVMMTNHLTHLTDEVGGLRAELVRGFDRLEDALRRQRKTNKAND